MGSKRLRHRHKYVCAKLLQLCPTPCDPWTVAHQVPLSLGFSRQEYWSGPPCPSAPLALGPSASGWPPSRAPEPSPLVTSDLAGRGGSGAGGLGDDLWGQTVSH